MKDARGNELMQKNNKLYKLDAIDYIDVLKKNIKSLVNSKSNKKEIIYRRSFKIFENN